MSVRERVLEASALKAKLGRTALTEVTLISELDMDSLSFMDLVMQIEESEQIILTDAEVGAVLAASTLGEFAAVIETAKQKSVSSGEFAT